MRVSLNTDAESRMAKANGEVPTGGGKGERSGCTWRHTSGVAGTSPSLSPRVDGLMGVEATVTLKRLASRLVAKRNQP